MHSGHDPVQQDQAKKPTGKFTFRLTRSTLVLSIAILSIIMMFSGWQLISYTTDYLASQDVSDELRDIYYEETPAGATASVPTPAPDETVASAVTPAAPAAETASPAKLAVVPYPQNPYGQISNRFLELRKKSRDIVGWMRIDGVVDEPVVQRDNVYYLTRDYMGKDNVNGALFLDEFTSLSTRPYTLSVYGHNMRTGAMFGGLRHYNDAAWYGRNPFITFDTMYEDGRYVVFASSVISVNPANPQCFDFNAMNSVNGEQRSRAIRQLQDTSVIVTGIDVQPEDQVLLLITCVENEDDRHIVAARRIRPDETEAALRTVTLMAVER